MRRAAFQCPSVLIVLVHKAIFDCVVAVTHPGGSALEVSVDAGGDVKVSPVLRSEKAPSRSPDLLDAGTGQQRSNTSSVAGEHSSATCTALTNHGTHFTVKLEVGTPGQSFSLVADTGSNAVIITSCLCRERGKCNEDLSCFHGTGKSSTFVIQSGLVGESSDEGPPMVSMRFGSGEIEAVIATDVVKIGNIEAKMQDSLLLMVDQALNIDGGLEGILGLGPPNSRRQSRQCNVDNSGNERDSEEDSKSIVVNSWLDQARIKRFSMCFKDGGNGVLQLGIPKPKVELDAIGCYHWGLDFQGIQVGKGKSFVPGGFCDDQVAPDGLQTQCGAIPDSGTTLIMAPEAHLRKLFVQICDLWPRCQHAAKSTDRNKALVLQDVLENCSQWMNSEKDLQELPELKMTLAGAHKRQILKLSGEAYVLEMMQNKVHFVKKHLKGFSNREIEVPEQSSVQERVCTPAFGVMEYNTKVNGPIWILGTPLFYAYKVSYYLNAKVPGIAFEEANPNECSSCGDGSAAAMSQQESTREEEKDGGEEEVLESSPAAFPRRRPRFLDPFSEREVRLPNLDVALPL